MPASPRAFMLIYRADVDISPYAYSDKRAGLSKKRPALFEHIKTEMQLWIYHL